MPESSKSSVSPQKYFTSHLPHTHLMPCPSHSSLAAGKIFVEEYRSISSSVCGFLHSPVTTSLLGPNCPLIPLLKHPHSSPPHCEQPCFTPIQNNRQNYSFVHLIFKSLVSKLEDKRFCMKSLQAFPDFNAPLISS